MTAYLDTNVVLWLAERDLARISSKAQEVIRSSDLLLSPAVLLELQYLFEIKRIAFSSRDMLRKLGYDLDVQVCDLAFPLVIEAALDESWTREPFDRLIVAQAKANGYAALVTADTKIRAHYTRAMW